jgi:arsenate reductase (thioredoxin)
VSRPRVLFVCVQNAGRSQIAQALYERRGGDARSAGSAPAERVHPEVVEVLREVGLEVGDRRPRGLSREDVEWAELVVTMGCGDECPYIPGKRYIDWGLDDPSGRPLDDVRRIRDDIGRRVDRLLGELDGAPR